MVCVSIATHSWNTLNEHYPFMCTLTTLKFVMHAENVSDLSGFVDCKNNNI